MKKKVIIILAVVVCIAVAVVAFLSVGRAGGEIGFEATINRVEPEYNMAYATVTKQDTGLFSKKLPESIMFETADLDEELNAGDKISGCYLSGSINGQTVRVVSVSVITDKLIYGETQEPSDSDIIQGAGKTLDPVE